MQSITVHDHISAYAKPVGTKRPASITRLSCNEPLDERSRFFYLPKEIWLKILVNYGVSAKDLSSLECSCKWFSTCCQGNSVYSFHSWHSS